MKFVYNGYVYDDDFVKKLNEKCREVNAHGFKNYLHDSVYGGKSAIERIREIRKKSDNFQTYNNEKKLNLSQDELLEIVKNFYKQLSPSIGEKVDSILNKENPNSDYKLEIVTDPNNEKFGRSNVSHSDRNQYLNVNISLDGSVEGLRVTAHEMSHAISGHQTKKIELLKQNDENKFLDLINSLGKYDRDCIGEIESHIIEYLFMQYLVDNNIISNADFKTFEVIRHNSLLNNLDLIREEYLVLNGLSCPITTNSFEQFHKKINTPFIKTNKYKSLMNRSKFMAERNIDNNTNNHYSQYRFRYVIGEIVSTLWFEKYCKSSKEEQQEMIKSFEKYLSKTDSATLETACSELIGLSIGDSFNDYIYHIQSKKFTI